MPNRVIVKGNVGNALHSVAPDHILGTADEIFDESSQEYQSEINAGAVRADKDQSLTEEQKAKALENQGVVIAQGSDFTNPDATKRAKVPTVGAVLDGLNDGVYDVSKRNPTGGPNSDGKFTLEYILNNADTLIPTSQRHGGMTIKYVQSSDNKYVQYRYMGTATTGSPNPFLDTTNWQGVDDEPIAGSKNLVESWGAYNNGKYVENLINGSSEIALESATDITSFPIKANTTYIFQRTSSETGVTLYFKKTKDGQALVNKTIPGSPTEFTFNEDYDWIAANKACQISITYKDNINAKLLEIASNFLKTMKLDGGVELTSGQNLNSITTPNSYYAASNIVSSLINAPTAESFRLFVLKTSEQSGYRIQIVFSVAGKIYIRRYTGSAFNEWNEITNKEIDKSLFAQLQDGDLIAKNSDLNTYTSVGTYYAGSGEAGTLSNTPYNGAFRMFVIRSNNTNESKIQLLVCVGKLGVYIRRYSGSTWGDWVTYATTDDLTTLKNESILASNGTEIQANSDLNDYTSSGSYYAGSSAGASVVNTPDYASKGAFRLIVIQYNSINTSRVQFYIDSNGKTFYRRYSGSVWGKWSQELNDEEEMKIKAASNYGRSGLGVLNKYKNFSMLITTDVHQTEDIFNRAIIKLNNTDAIDAGICLGDIARNNYSQTDGTWYTSLVNKSNKPFFTVIGNHDGGNSADISISGTKQQVFSKWIQPTLSKIGIQDLTKTYYRKDFSDYKVTLIVLDNYDVPDTIDSVSGNFNVSRGVECFSQEQIDWLVSQLQTIPNDHHLLIARHSGAGASWTVDTDNLWTNPTDAEIEASEMAYAELPINDIVQAWRNGGVVNKTYAPTSYTSYLPTINVSADFSARGNGVFVCYIVGHHHADVVAEDANGQKIFEFDCTALDTFMNFRSDLPRVVNTETQDLFTLIGINTTERTIRLVRIGSHITTSMRNRDMLCVTY